jgi:L-lactate dehydrogenase complex protein LldG
MIGRPEARTAVLARIRAAQRTAVLPSMHRGEVIESPPVQPAPTVDLLERFEHELAALGVELHHSGTPDELRETVRRIVGTQRVLSWDRDALPHDVFDELHEPLTGAHPRGEQASAEIGVTACDAAVAETGSLVLLSGPGRARTASLLPRIHLAIVRRADVVPTLGDAFHCLHDRIRASASCTVITGPSRTADIELTLTLGIHGPGRIIVVIAS